MVFHDSRLVLYGFSWFQVGFSWFQVGFHCFSWFQVGFVWFFMVLGGVLWFFMVPVLVRRPEGSIGTSILKGLNQTNSYSDKFG